MSESVAATATLQALIAARLVLMIQILPTCGAASVPHRHVLAALAFDVVPNHARAQQAAARAAAGWRRIFVRIVAHVRTARRRLRSGMMMRRLPPCDRLALQHVACRSPAKRIGDLDN